MNPDSPHYGAPPGNPEMGRVYWNTLMGELRCFNGISWEPVHSASPDQMVLGQEPDCPKCEKEYTLKDDYVCATCRYGL